MNKIKNFLEIKKNRRIVVIIFIVIILINGIRMIFSINTQLAINLGKINGISNQLNNNNRWIAYNRKL